MKSFVKWLRRSVWRWNREKWNFTSLKQEKRNQANNYKICKSQGQGKVLQSKNPTLRYNPLHHLPELLGNKLGGQACLNKRKPYWVPKQDDETCYWEKKRRKNHKYLVTRREDIYQNFSQWETKTNVVDRRCQGTLTFNYPVIIGLCFIVWEM